MSGIKVNGLDQLNAKLRKNLDLKATKTVVRHNGAELQKKVEKNTDNFKGHYEWVKGEGLKFVTPSGNLKRHVTLSIKDSGLTAVVEPEVDYAEYVEYGTRFMEAQPYLKPALDEQKRIFKSDLEKITR